MIPSTKQNLSKHYLVKNIFNQTNSDESLHKKNKTLKEASERLSYDSCQRRKIDDLVQQRMTQRSIKRALYFREKRPLSVISGAGLAGLTVAFEFRAGGRKVIIAEKREQKNITRFNIVNLSAKTQAFLRRFNLQEKFEKFVAARINEHRYIVLKEGNQA